MPETIATASTENTSKLNKALVQTLALRIGGTIVVTTGSVLLANAIDRKLTAKSSSN